MLKSFDFQQRIVQKENLLASQVISVECIFCQIHADVQIGLLGFYVGFLSVKSQIFDSFAQGKILSKIKKLWEYSLSAKRLSNKNRADPPNVLVLVSEEHCSNRFTVDFFDERLSIIGLDQILHSLLNEVFVEYFVFGLQSQIDHELSHGCGVWFLCNLHHLKRICGTGSTKKII